MSNGPISTPPAPGARDFFRAILTRRRSPGPIPRLGFHPRAFRRGPEHGLGWDFAGAGGGAFRQNAAPDVRTARPGPDFFLSCVSVGAVPVADPPSQVPPTRVPAGAQILEFYIPYCSHCSLLHVTKSRIFFTTNSGQIFHKFLVEVGVAEWQSLVKVWLKFG